MKRKDLHNVVMLMLDEADEISNRTEGTNVDVIGCLRMLSAKVSTMSNLEYEKWYTNRAYLLVEKQHNMYKHAMAVKLNEGGNK